jgi:hypothetical protein
MKRDLGKPLASTYGDDRKLKKAKRMIIKEEKAKDKATRKKYDMSKKEYSKMKKENNNLF